MPLEVLKMAIRSSVKLYNLGKRLFNIDLSLLQVTTKQLDLACFLLSTNDILMSMHSCDQLMFMIRSVNNFLYIPVDSV